MNHAHLIASLLGVVTYIAGRVYVDARKRKRDNQSVERARKFWANLLGTHECVARGCAQARDVGLAGEAWCCDSDECEHYTGSRRP